VIIGLVALASTATFMDIMGGTTKKIKWMLCWSIRRRWDELIEPERRVKGLPLQSLSAIRIISILLIIGSHHGYHIPKRPLINDYVHKEVNDLEIKHDVFVGTLSSEAHSVLQMYTSLLLAPFTHGYMFLWTILFISGLFLALKAEESFFKSLTLRYFR